MDDVIAVGEASEDGEAAAAVAVTQPLFTGDARGVPAPPPPPH